MAVFLTRSYVLPALHTLGSGDLSSEENLRIFGPCSRLHGHDYRIEVTVTGPVKGDSGLLVQRELSDEIVESRLIEKFRLTNLSAFFSNTAGEALASEFFSILRTHFPDPLRLSSVLVRETPKNSFLVGDLP